MDEISEALKKRIADRKAAQVPIAIFGMPDKIDKRTDVEIITGPQNPAIKGMPGYLTK
jgi:hypothetical protein